MAARWDNVITVTLRRLLMLIFLMISAISQTGCNPVFLTMLSGSFRRILGE